MDVDRFRHSCRSITAGAIRKTRCEVKTLIDVRVISSEPLSRSFFHSSHVGTLMFDQCTPLNSYESNFPLDLAVSTT